jgi:hypothetical protein
MAANAPTCAHHCAMQVVYKIVSLDGADWRGWSIRATDGWVARYFVCFSRRCRIIHLVNRWRLGKIAAQSETPARYGASRWWDRGEDGNFVLDRVNSHRPSATAAPRSALSSVLTDS